MKSQARVENRERLNVPHLNSDGELPSEQGVAFTVRPIGMVHTPRRQGALLSPISSMPERWIIEVFPRFSDGLESLEAGATARLLTYQIDPEWGCASLGNSRAFKVHGSSTASSLHPLSPIRITHVKLIGREMGSLLVEGLGMEDGTPVIDIQAILPAVGDESVNS